MGQPPWEYTELLLCREWHCKPSDLESEDYDVVMTTIEMLGVEANVARAKRGHTKPATSGQRGASSRPSSSRRRKKK